MNNYPANDGFLVCIDSDGSVFDSMTLKHRECFAPAFIKHFRLQQAGRLAQETWEYVNLNSKDRGSNRFKALLQVLGLLRLRPEIQATGIDIPRLDGLAAWVAREPQLSNSSLEAALTRSPDPDLERALAWSNEINQVVERTMGDGVAPFRAAVRALTAISLKSDIIVVSQGPAERIAHEWAKQGLSGWPLRILGQEHGTKTGMIENAMVNRYRENHVLVIGDALGDLDAARENNSLFFPITPGREESSWELLLNEGLERFFEEEYSESYSDGLIAAFKASLLDYPPWRHSR